MSKEIWASVTERGQVTIPAEVRKALGLRNRGKVLFRVEDGVVIMQRPRFASVADVAGSVPGLKAPKTWDQVEQQVQDEAVAEYRKQLEEGNA